MSSPKAGKRRRDTDLLKLIQTRHEVTMLPDPHEFCVRFHGPLGTPYEGGIWNIRVYVTEDYPFKSPSVGFMNRVFHPNIDEETGTVCLNVLNHAWTPVYDFTNIFDTFLPQLLTYPNATDPLNKSAAVLFLRKPDQYKEVVQAHIRKYATDKVLKRQEDDDSDSDSNHSTLSECHENC